MAIDLKLKVDESILQKIHDEKLLKVLKGEEEAPYKVLKKKLMTIQPPKYNLSLPRYTASLCPECGKIISAKLYEKDGKVMISKKCPDHGEFEDIYYSDVEI
ncbi:MAG: hypothetical protein ABGF52_13330, partial [Candidatus Asgardarchaeum sp.]